MSGRLPQTVQPERLAETGAVLRGSVSLGSMTRLATYLYDAEGGVEVELAFGIDEQGIKYTTGRIQAVLHLICQRCLQSLKYPLDVETTLGLVRPEEAPRLPEGYEPLIFEEPSVDLARIVEDELILALPIVPMHAPNECQVRAEPAPNDQAGTDRGDDERRPFAQLADLMKKQK